MFPYKLVDLTHVLSSDIPNWEGRPKFNCEVYIDYKKCPRGMPFRVQFMHMDAGSGTHIDVPAHYVPGGKTVEQIEVEKLAAPLVVIDVSAQSHETYSMTVEDIIDYEKQNGMIPDKACVMVYTGWSKKWNDPVAYRNNVVYPSVTVEAAKLLLERNITSLGIDTLAPDRPADGFPVHEVLFAQDKYIIENVANLDTVPVVGAYVVIMPMNVAGATEAATRVVALIP
jgi:kynurenine formamidase